MICHKYLISDNQETCFTDYKLTDKYYSCREMCEKDWGGENTEHCFGVVAPLKQSKQTGRIAEILTRHERARRS